ncbi:MAG TPA: DUF488 domain-containing protein [Ktedonobacterales bacterium]|nr:DUF488 domain-containing protein [Ktedonobacterales bacterium]
MPQDDTAAPDAPPTVYTIGHSNHPLDTFLALLERHGIRTLVDVRSQPYSRYVTHFNREELESAVERRKVKYVFGGDELGGRPVGAEFYDAESHVRYGRVATSVWFRAGIEALLDEAALAKTAILCSEEDPIGCHRHLLIARVLAGQGVPVFHIRADDREQPEAELAAPPPRPAAEQLSLFGEAAPAASEEDAWRSIRPVSPRKAPPSSSGRSSGPASDDW